MEKDKIWNKLIIHGIPIKPFAMDEGLSLLKEEIEIFNPGLKLLKKSIWLSSQENRQVKQHASILIAVENTKQAQLTMENRLCIAGNWLIAKKCKETIFQKQCQNYQKYGHSIRACFAQSICQICAKQHHISQHKCSVCNTQGQNCPHSILKCRNCGENHMANSEICGFKINIEKKTTRYSQNSHKKQQVGAQSFQVVINNAGK
jgi:hypothetical protein